MPHDIIDNREEKLVKVLKEKLSVSKRAKFAVGWLFLSGFKELRNEIDNLEKLEILAGARTNKQTVEALLLEQKWEKAVADTLEKTKFLPEDKRQEILENEFKELVNDLSYIKPTPENIEFLKWFLEKLKERKIIIRIYYKETLHSKLYLFDYKDPRHGKGEVIIGSSNFSVSGFSLNTELNVRVLGDDNHDDLNNWFENLWQESGETDFTALAQKAIEKSWAFNEDATPFRLYLRALHEIFSYQEKEPEIEIEANLYRFQEDAVVDAYKRLKKYNGVFIADVPGLGKTYIGSALLSHLETEGKPAIVIVPPRLKDYWEEVLSDLGVAKAKVFSSGKLEEILESEKYLKRKIVLIDESHHFKNPETNRYRDLAKICEGKEVILLSATPQNLSIWDLYWQIKLFTPYEANHFFGIYPIELKEYFKACENGQANIEDLIGEVFIRRTRSDIKEYYPDEKIVFPERKGPYRIDYSIDKVYEGGLYERLRILISRLNYARYNLGKYAKEEKFDADELQRLTVAWQNLQRLVKMNLYRRLESSIQALKDTLSNHLRIHRRFYEILTKEKKIFIGDINKIEEEAEKLANEEIEDSSELKLEGETFYQSDKFYEKRLKEELEGDIEIFQEMYDSVKDIRPENDDKLQRLIGILNKEVAGKKLIIFSSFESTVKYIFENLKNTFSRVDYIAGGEKFLTKIKKFAPKANKAKISPSEEIQLLVSTEVLAEGLNLQDGQVVINYDLHWNPVRIIQRIGRIDRIGSLHDEIFLYNFFPETKADKEINITKKINKRIDEIIQNFGYDEKTIRMDEPTVRKKLFDIWNEKAGVLEEEEEDKSTSKYFEFEFKKLSQEHPNEYKKALELPAMTNIARVNKNKGILVFCRADDYFGLKLADTGSQIINSDRWKILKILKSGLSEKGKKFDQRYFDIVENIKEEFEKEANKREFDKEEITDPTKREFEGLIKWLKRKASQETKTGLNNLWDFIQSKQLNYEQSKMIRKLSRSYKKKFGLDRKQILRELENQIYAGLEEAPDFTKPEVKPRYAQVIIAEEFK